MKYSTIDRSKDKISKGVKGAKSKDKIPGTAPKMSGVKKQESIKELKVALGPTKHRGLKTAGNNRPSLTKNPSDVYIVLKSQIFWKILGS